jgi:hypothetical protein
MNHKIFLLVNFCQFLICLIKSLFLNKFMSYINNNYFVIYKNNKFRDNNYSFSQNFLNYNYQIY